MLHTACRDHRLALTEFDSVRHLLSASPPIPPIGGLEDPSASFEADLHLLRSRGWARLTGVFPAGMCVQNCFLRVCVVGGGGGGGGGGRVSWRTVWLLSFFINALGLRLAATLRCVCRRHGDDGTIRCDRKGARGSPRPGSDRHDAVAVPAQPIVLSRRQDCLAESSACVLSVG